MVLASRRSFLALGGPRGGSCSSVPSDAVVWGGGVVGALVAVF